MIKRIHFILFMCYCTTKEKNKRKKSRLPKSFYLLEIHLSLIAEFKIKMEKITFIISFHTKRIKALGVNVTFF